MNRKRFIKSLLGLATLSVVEPKKLLFGNILPDTNYILPLSTSQRYSKIYLYNKGKEQFDKARTKFPTTLLDDEPPTIYN